MIYQIVSHTPVYVWALLGFLLYRGYLASRDREVSLAKLSIIPVVMVVLSLAGMNAQGPLGGGVWAVWLVAVAAGAALTLKAGKGDIVVNRAAGTLQQQGSWMPLMMMIAIFITKYTVAVSTVMHPALRQDLLFSFGVTLLFGLFNGVFIGRLARYIRAWLCQSAAVAI